MGIYKQALIFYKLSNVETSYAYWLDANFQKTFNNRINSFNFVKTNNYKIGCNIICNRLHVQNVKIEYCWLNELFFLQIEVLIGIPMAKGFTTMQNKIGSHA